MDKRATCRKILRKTALSVLAASILMAGTVDAVRAEETPNVLQTVEAESGTLLGKAKIAATGTCVSGLEHTGDGVEVTVTVPEDGLYDIIVRTAVIGGGTKSTRSTPTGSTLGISPIAAAGRTRLCRMCGWRQAIILCPSRQAMAGLRLIRSASVGQHPCRRMCTKSSRRSSTLTPRTAPSA